MKQYCSNIGFCRRKLLIREFIENYESNCDPAHTHKRCGRECSCAECNGLDLTEKDVASSLAEDDDVVTVRIERSKKIVSKEQRTRIQQLLTKYRTDLCMVDKQPVPLLYGP